MNWYVQNWTQNWKHFPLLHSFFEWAVMNLWIGRHSKPSWIYWGRDDHAFRWFFFPLLLEILVMSWSQDWIFLFFGCAWFKLWCCIGTPDVPWLLLLLLWLTPSLWPLLQGRAVAISYSTLHAAWFHCACIRSFDTSLGTDLESSDPSLKCGCAMVRFTFRPSDPFNFF